MSDTVFRSAVFYRDPSAAAQWLSDTFGFEISLAIEGPPGAPEMCHYELSHEGRGTISVGGQWAPWARSPSSVQGTNTQTIRVMLERGVDEHCERARAAGATIEAEPEEQFYGDRTYRAVDPEGHRWTFAQTVRQVSKAEAEQALGQPIEGTGWE